VRRWLKLTLGIPMVLLGFFVVIGGAAAMVIFGPDGTFELRSGLDSSGHAIVFDALSLRGLRDSGAFRADVTIDVTLDEGDPAFVGIAPRSDAAAYLADAAVDRVVQLRPIGGLATERVEGPPTVKDPAAPDSRTFWEASAEGDPARLTWTASSGDWSIVVMRADATQGIHGDGTLSLRVGAFGPIAIALLIVGLLLLGGGGALIVSGAKTPRRAAPPRPDAV
jgi:hypothetical protein